MSFEVGAAHVSIFPKIASGFGSQIRNALKGGDTAGAEAGKSTGNAFASHLKAILAGAVITKAISGLAGLFKNALSGGLARLMGVEEAQAKMRGLGHSAEAAAAVVKQAQKAVDGTIYTTAEASTVAANALAAGIKPGKDLDRVLSAVANAASTAGTDMGEMGSIFNKVASVGKAQNDSLQRVADRGIPIYKALADQLGVSTEEVFKLASAGKIGFAEFEQAMTTATGTVAEEMGKTLSGALANTRSALSKIGENLLAGIYPALTPLMLGMREALRGLQGPAEALGVTFGNWLTPKAEALGEALQKIPSFVRGMKLSPREFEAFGVQLDEAGKAGFRFADSWRQIAGKAEAGISAISTATEPLRGRLDGLWESVQEGARQAFSKAGEFATGFVEGFGGFDTLVAAAEGILPALTGPLGLVKAALMDAFDPAVFDNFRNIDFAELGRVVGEGMQPVIAMAGELAESVTAGISEVFESLITTALDLAQQIGPPLEDMGGRIADVLGNLAQDVVPALGSAYEAVSQAMGDMVEALGPMVGAMVEQLAPVFASIAEDLGPKVSELLQNLAGLVEELAPIFSAVFEGVLRPLFENLTIWAEAAMQGLAAIFGGWLDIVNGIFATFTAALQGDWEGALAGIQQTTDGVLQQIGGIIDAALGLFLSQFGVSWSDIKATTERIFGEIVIFVLTIPGKVGTALEPLSQLGARAAEWFGGVVRAATEKFNEVVAFIATIPGKIMSALAGLAQLAAKAAEWFGGFLRAAQEKFGEVISFVAGIPGRIISALGNVGSLLVNAGSSMIKGLADGIRRGFSNAMSAVSDGMAKLRSYFPFSPAKTGPFSGKGYTTHSGKKLMEDFGVGLSKGTSAVVSAGWKAMNSLASGIKTGGTKAAKEAAAASKKIAEQFDKDSAALVKKIVGVQETMTVALREQGATLYQGTAKQADEVLKKWTEQILKAVTPTTQALANYIAVERENLGKLLEQRDEITKQLEEANKKLADQIKAKDAYESGLAGKLFDTSAILKDGAAASDMIAELAEQVRATADLRKNLATLASMGLSDEVLDKLAQAGAKQGGAAAAALVTGGKAAVDQINALQAQLQRDSEAIAATMASRMYDAGIKATQGLVDGMLKQKNEVGKAAGVLANEIAATIKRELKIKSPSRVMAELGRYTGIGLWTGLADEESMVARTAKRLAAAAVPGIATRTAGGDDPAASRTDRAVASGIWASSVTARLAREDIDLLARAVVSMAQGVSSRTVDSAFLALGRGL